MNLYSTSLLKGDLNFSTPSGTAPLINSSIKIGKNHSCEYIELPNFENGHLQLLELKYANKIIKEGIRTYIKL